MSSIQTLKKFAMSKVGLTIGCIDIYMHGIHLAHIKSVSSLTPSPQEHLHSRHWCAAVMIDRFYDQVEV